MWSCSPTHSLQVTLSVDNLLSADSRTWTEDTGRRVGRRHYRGCTNYKNRTIVLLHILLPDRRSCRGYQLTNTVCLVWNKLSNEHRFVFVLIRCLLLYLNESKTKRTEDFDVHRFEKEWKCSPTGVIARLTDCCSNDKNHDKTAKSSAVQMYNHDVWIRSSKNLTRRWYTTLLICRIGVYLC